jgi:hypothetical protein
MKRTYNIGIAVLTLALLAFGSELLAQGPPGGGGPGGGGGCIPPPCVPIDGGLAFLAIAGAGLAYKTMRRKV